MSRAEELAGRLRETAAMHPTLDHRETDEWQAADLLDRYAKLERAARELDDASRHKSEIFHKPNMSGDEKVDALLRLFHAWEALRAALAELEG